MSPGFAATQPLIPSTWPPRTAKEVSPRNRFLSTVFKLANLYPSAAARRSSQSPRSGGASLGSRSSSALMICVMMWSSMRPSQGHSKLSLCACHMEFHRIASGHGTLRGTI